MSRTPIDHRRSSVAYLSICSLCLLAGVLVQAAPCGAQPPAQYSPVLDAAFIRITAGTFLSGSQVTEPGARMDEQQHRVTLTRDFWLGATELSQRQWLAVMDENPSYLYDCSDCPVELVSWIDAIRFCNALSALENLTPAYTLSDTLVIWNREADGYRLPTEAEWEYACRAGTTGSFSTGRCLTSDAANYDGYRPQVECDEGFARGQVLDVGSLEANPWGLHDMHGNVYEWCWDRHSAFTGESVRDPVGPELGVNRMVRGGCFLEPENRCRSGSRGSLPPDRRSSCVGFRLARSVP